MTWFRWQSALDFAILAAALYLVLLWANGARALRIVLGIIGSYALARLSGYLDLVITSWVLDGISILLVLLLLFVFQAELRHALLRVDSLLRLGLRPRKALESGYRTLAGAIFDMASERLGGLVVVARNDSVRELVSTGVPLGAEISAQLLEAVFQKDSPIHDGAVVIEAQRVSAAGVVLPLTQRVDVPSAFGTRHRAAMGLAERCDALVVVVSEERGEVTVMNKDRIIPVPGQADLLRLLEEPQNSRRASLAARLARFLFANMRLKLAATAVAGLVWSLSFLNTGTIIRTIGVPIEFARVPAGMDITSQSAQRLEVQLRGSPLVMDSVVASGLVARVDLRDAAAGARTLTIAPDTLNLPPGVTVERISPKAVTVRLVTKSP